MGAQYDDEQVFFVEIVAFGVGRAWASSGLRMPGGGRRFRERCLPDRVSIHGYRARRVARQNQRGNICDPGDRRENHKPMVQMGPSFRARISGKIMGDYAKITMLVRCIIWTDRDIRFEGPIRDGRFHDEGETFTSGDSGPFVGTLKMTYVASR